MVDQSLSTIEVLQEVAESGPSEVDVAVGSGFTGGAEVCKAVALGARLVGIGLLQRWGLAAGGSEMLLRVPRILERR